MYRLEEVQRRWVCKRAKSSWGKSLHKSFRGVNDEKCHQLLALKALLYWSQIAYLVESLLCSTSLLLRFFFLWTNLWHFQTCYLVVKFQLLRCTWHLFYIFNGSPKFMSSRKKTNNYCCFIMGYHDNIF